MPKFNVFYWVHEQEDLSDHGSVRSRVVHANSSEDVRLPRRDRKGAYMGKILSVHELGTGDRAQAAPEKEL